MDQAPTNATAQPSPANHAKCDREAFRRVHLQDEARMVPLQVHQVAAEEIAHRSPDGRAADHKSWSRGMIAMAVLLFGCIPAVLLGVVIFYGADALLLGLVYVAIVLFSAFPVWYAGLMRQREEREAADIVLHTLSEHGKQDAGS